MPQTPGQEPGHLNWDTLVAGWVAERGSLAAVARHLAQRRNFSEDAESAERGLRRLRHRGVEEGGVWGVRALRCFGLPNAVVDRVRWMGQYHSRFTDLPVSLGAELLSGWDRPPVSESPARIWVLLGKVSVAIRRHETPEAHLKQAALMVARSEVAAQVELALVQAYVWHRSQPKAGQAALDKAEALLASASFDADLENHACLFARWIDQKAYPLNRPRTGLPNHSAAEALYLRIPKDGPLFARCRRENGLGWTRLRLGQRTQAMVHVRAGLQAAGDSGSLRLRAMALNLLARVAQGEDAVRAQSRALQIAQHLEDEALKLRFDRRRKRP